MKNYIIGIDQSTQGTKALLFDKEARLIDRADMPHEQKISKEGYVSHDLTEIW
ncbi:MAG: glycerol kinase, partial [Lachnospiraceae bacterium]|nr:glycerol kinase [Lachnospiraceae bacterium]